MDLTPLSVLSKPKSEFSADKIFYTERMFRMLGNEEELLSSTAPWTVDIQPTSICNQHCVYCSYGERNKSLTFLSLKTMNEIHEDLCAGGVRGIIYTGGGDPLMWKSEGLRLEQFISQWSYPTSTALGLVTNGVYLHKVLESEAFTKFHWITISMDAHTTELYSSVTGSKPEDFIAQQKNVLAAIETKRKMRLQYPEITVKFMVNRQNYMYINELYKHAHTFGADHILFRCVNNFEKDQDVELSQEEMAYVRNCIERHSDIDAQYKQHFVDSLTFEDSINQVLPHKCWTVMLGHNCLITASGKVFICTPTTDYDDFCIGNVKNGRFRDIWCSEKHKEVAKNLNYRATSGGCPLSACRHHRYNLLIDAGVRNKTALAPPSSEFDERHGCFI